MGFVPANMWPEADMQTWLINWMVKFLWCRSVSPAECECGARGCGRSAGAQSAAAGPNLQPDAGAEQQHHGKNTSLTQQLPLDTGWTRNKRATKCGNI